MGHKRAPWCKCPEENAWTISPCTWCCGWYVHSRNGCALPLAYASTGKAQKTPWFVGVEDKTVLVRCPKATHTHTLRTPRQEQGKKNGWIRSCRAPLGVFRSVEECTAFRRDLRAYRSPDVN